MRLPLPTSLKNSLHHFHPRLLDYLHGYDRGMFAKDFTAGLTVGIVALPLAMAFAIASGVKPEAGIFTAIIAGFLIAALGGSPVQIGGPAGAFIVIIYGIIDRYGLANLLIATIMAGMLLFTMGLFKLGSLVRYIPVGIVIGFTNGIAVLIAISQIKDFLGLQIDEKMPGDFFGSLATLFAYISTISPITVLLGTSSLILIAVWPRFVDQLKLRSRARIMRHKALQGPPRPLDVLWQFRDKAHLSHHLSSVPGSIVALILGTSLVAFFHLPVETIGTRFGGIPQGLPTFELPHFTWRLAKELIPPTITIALLGAIESLLCARVADGLLEGNQHERHDPNQELMAQGIANFVTPFFGGICATGTIARTVTNIRNGAVSPIAGMIHSAILLFIILVAAPLAMNVPLVTLSAILFVVAYNMGEWHEFMRLKHFSNNYKLVMLSTFFLTVVFDLTVAVEVGLVLSAILFIYRMSSLTHIEPIDLTSTTFNRGLQVNTDKPNNDVEAYRIFGSLFFGAVSTIEGLIRSDAEQAQLGLPPHPLPKVMILELHQLISLDTTGVDALLSLYKRLRKKGSRLVLCGANEQPASLLVRSGFAHTIGEPNILPTLATALDRAQVLLAMDASEAAAIDAANDRDTNPVDLANQAKKDQNTSYSQVV